MSLLGENLYEWPGIDSSPWVPIDPAFLKQVRTYLTTCVINPGLCSLHPLAAQYPERAPILGGSHYSSLGPHQRAALRDLEGALKLPDSFLGIPP